MIQKDLFIKALEQIKKDGEMAEELNSIFIKYDRQDFFDGFCFTNEKITSILITILDKSFDKNCDWVDYFVCELYCGENWSPEMVVDTAGNSIDISTPEKLYDFLCKEYNK